MPKIVMEINVPSESIDTELFAWVEELIEKAQEQGEVAVCKVTGLPTELFLVGGPQ